MQSMKSLPESNGSELPESIDLKAHRESLEEQRLMSLSETEFHALANQQRFFAGRKFEAAERKNNRPLKRLRNWRNR